MRWQGREESENVDDRRGRRVPGGAKGLGLGALVVVLLGALLGTDLTPLLKMFGANAAESGPSSGGPVGPRADDELASFAKTVLRDTEQVWEKIFRADGATYRPPTLVLFDDAVQSACGTQSSAVGPFYCPGDQQVYLDLAFFEQLERQLGAGGDFAQAYVIAHEVGHHIQNLFGTSGEVHQEQQRLGEAERNALSVRLELQADYYAGVWAHHAQKMFGSLEPGDIEEAMNAAKQIGDDTLQKNARGHAVPDSFTHGTSKQRMTWFMRGYQRGDLSSGDTFSVDERDL